MKELYLIFSARDHAPTNLGNAMDQHNWAANDQSPFILNATGHKVPDRNTDVRIDQDTVVIASDGWGRLPGWIDESISDVERLCIVLHLAKTLDDGNDQMVCYRNILDNRVNKLTFISKENHTEVHPTGRALNAFFDPVNTDPKAAFQKLLEDLRSNRMFRDIRLNPAIAVLQHFENFQREGKGVSAIASSTGELKQHWEALTAWALPIDNDETFRTALVTKIKELMQ